jgi:Leucine-rich repeat (LRR) protein
LTLQIALSSAGCRYFFGSGWPGQGYACEYSGARIIHDDDTLQFVGEHIENRTNLNVTAVRFINSRLDALPANLFTEFPNMNFLQASNVHLKRLSAKTIGNCSRMANMILSNNSISRLDDGVFPCPILSEIDLRWNHINRIGANVFRQTPGISRINLSHNRLTQIPTNQFSDLRHIHQLDLNFNEISELAPDSFRNFGDTRSFSSRIVLAHNKLERLSSNIFGRTTTYTRVQNLANDRSFFKISRTVRSNWMKFSLQVWETMSNH